MIPFLNMLLKGRKAEGPVTEHRPVAVDSQGRLLTSQLTYAPVEVGNTAPTTIDGTVLWNNTTAGMEGLYFYDLARSKWLSVDSRTYTFGGDALDNQLARTECVNSAGVGTGHLVEKNITIVGVYANARAGNQTKQFNIRLNQSVVASFSLTSRKYADSNANIDIAGSATSVLDIFVAAAGGNTNDITIDLVYRRMA